MEYPTKGISFKAFLSKRMQKELLGSELPKERFEIIIINNKIFPITVIIPDGEYEFFGDSSPLEYVPLIELFLKNNCISEKVSIEFLHTIPINFYLWADEKTAYKDYEYFKIPSINIKPFSNAELEVKVNPKHFTLSNQLIEKLFSRVDFSREIELYYLIEFKKMLLDKLWGEVDYKRRYLEFIYKGKNTKVKKAVDDVMFKLTDFELANTFITSEFHSYFNEVYRNGNSDQAKFKPFIDKQMESITNYPSESVRNLINHVETRRANSILIYITIFAPVIGVIIGAILTKLFLTP